MSGLGPDEKTTDSLLPQGDADAADAMNKKLSAHFSRSIVIVGEVLATAPLEDTDRDGLTDLQEALRYLINLLKRDMSTYSDLIEIVDKVRNFSTAFAYVEFVLGTPGLSEEDTKKLQSLDTFYYDLQEILALLPLRGLVNAHLPFDQIALALELAGRNPEMETKLGYLEETSADRGCCGSCSPTANCDRLAGAVQCKAITACCGCDSPVFKKDCEYRTNPFTEPFSESTTFDIGIFVDILSTQLNLFVENIEVFSLSFSNAIINLPITDSAFVNDIDNFVNRFIRLAAVIRYYFDTREVPRNFEELETFMHVINNKVQPIYSYLSMMEDTMKDKKLDIPAFSNAQTSLKSFVTFSKMLHNYKSLLLRGLPEHYNLSLKR